MITKLENQKPLAVIKRERASIDDMNYNALPPEMEAAWYDAHKPTETERAATARPKPQPAPRKRATGGLSWFKLLYADGSETYMRAEDKTALINYLKELNRQYLEKLPVQIQLYSSNNTLPA